MAVSSPTGTGSETVTLPGRRLTGCRGWHRFCKLSIYTGVEKYKRCIFPHPAYIHFIKMPANPDNPSCFPFRNSPKTPLRFESNALAFEVKRTCVLSQMHLRFR